MRTLLFLLLASFSLVSQAAWYLDSESSRISFISIRGGDLAEVNYFRTLHGKISNKGEASLRIPQLRQALPPGLYFDQDQRPAHEATFRRLMDEIAATANFEAVLGVFGANFVAAQGPRLRGALNTLIAGVKEDDRLNVRESVIYAFEQGDRLPLRGGSTHGQGLQQVPAR